MATCTVNDVKNAARGYLHDTDPPSGAVWTNTALQVHFAEPYRRLFNCLMGVSKRVQRITYLNLPASTTVIVPAAYGLTDFAEPEIVEERPAQNSLAIAAVTSTTPISLGFSAPHGLGSVGQIVECVVSGVTATTAPWGRWFATITSPTNVTLNGSVGDVAGADGNLTPWSQLPFYVVEPIDQAQQGLDGIPQQYLGVYIWANEQLQFRGASGVQQLRITYWASGSAPSLDATLINIDNCIDFLACATAANAARANGWYALADQLKSTAYGSSQQSDCASGLLGEFVKIQVSTLQRGPQRRQYPFRQRHSKFGDYIPLG